MEMEYFLCSQAVVEQFPDLEKSKPFKSGYRGDEAFNYYVISTNDFESIEKFYNQSTENNIVLSDFWIQQCCDSQVEAEKITLSSCRKMGLFAAIEWHIGLTKGVNRAYTIYKLSRKFNCTPIEFINKISSTVTTKIKTVK